ncbi:MAG: glycosyltransferase family 4 protein [Candidatus Dormibacteria bacterium]
MSTPHHGLLIDMQGAQSRSHGERGIARYVRGHAAAMMRCSDRVRGLLLSPFAPFPGDLPAELATSPLLHWNTASACQQFDAGEALAYHLMSPFEMHDPTTALLPPHLMSRDIPLVVTLHDLIPYLMPDRYLPDPAWLKRYLQRAELIRSADLILAISDATRADAIRELGVPPERIVTVREGADDHFTLAPPGTDTLALARHHVPSIRGPYIFTVSAADWRKNTEGLIDAYAALPVAVRRRHQLVITCQLPEGWRQHWLSHARRAGCADDDVVLTGRLDDADVARLYQGTALFVFPSLYEGFGLPLAEAIACGAPAVTSGTTSLPEIIDLPAATFDPRDVQEISNVMERGLCDDAFRDELRDAGARRAPLFRWDAVAARTLDALDAVIQPPSSSGAGLRHRRLRLGLVTPVPPHSDPVASACARIIPHLAERADLDILHPDQDVRPMNPWPGVSCLAISGLGRYLNPFAYDALIYAIGNGRVHAATYEALVRFPGIVWFHDVRIPDLHRHHAEQFRIDHRHAIQGQLNRFYRTRAPEGASEHWGAEFVDRFRLYLTPELVQRARHAIVSSPKEEQLLRLDQGADIRCPPLTVVPLAGISDATVAARLLDVVRATVS